MKNSIGKIDTSIEEDILWDPELPPVKDNYDFPVKPIKPIYEEEPTKEPPEKQSGYIASGTVFDGKTYELLPFEGTFISVATGQRDTVFISTDGSFEAWTFNDPNNWVIEFKAKGYNKKRVLFSDLLLNNEVPLKKAIPWEIILIVIAAVYVYRKKTKKVGKLSTGDVFPIMLLAGGVLAFSMVKDILEFLGLWKDKDEKELDDVATDPDSYWSPNYWKTIKPANKNWTYAISQATAVQWCGEIQAAFGMFNDDEAAVIAVCKRCRTKANFSFLADIFQQIFGQDFLAYLRGGIWPEDRLSNEDVNQISNYIKNLPNY